MKIGTKKKILTGIFLIFILFFLSFFIIPKIVNSYFIKQKISTLLYQKTKFSINPSDFTFSVFPKVCLDIQNFKFNLEDNIDINFESINFNLNLYKLLQSKIRLDKILIDNPKILLRDLEEDQTRQPINKSFKKFIKYTKNIFIFLPKHQDSIEVTFKNLISPHFKQMDASLYLSDDRKSIILNADIHNMDFNMSVLPENSFKKYLDLNNLKLDELKLNVKIESEGSIQGICHFISPKIKSSKNILLFDSDDIESSFTLSDNFFEIDIKPSKLNYPNSVFSSHFATDHDLKKSEINFSGFNIHIDQAKEISLALFKHNDIINTIFGILHKGFVPKVDVSFQSDDIKDLFNPDNFILDGNINEGRVHIPETKLIVSNVSGKAQIKNGILDINVASGTIESSIIEKGKLWVNLLKHDYFPFQGDFELDIDLSMIPKTITSLLPDTLLSKELSLVHDVTGRTRTQLNLSRETMGKELDVIINTQDFSIKGIYDRIPNDIELNNLNFSYKDDVVIVKNLNGNINGSKIFDLNAKIDFKNSVFIEIPSGSGTISLDTTIPWLMSYNKPKDIISPLKAAKGNIQFNSINFQGPVLNPEKWNYNITGIGQGINLAIFESSKINPGVKISSKLKPYQIENLFCQYDITNNYLNLYKINMRLNSFSWLEYFTENQFLKNIMGPVNLKNGVVEIDQIKSFLTGDIKIINGPDIFIDLTGKNFDSLSLNKIKILDQGFSNASFSFNHKNKISKYKFDGILHSNTLSKIIKPESYWTKKINEFTEGEPMTLYRDNNANLNISAKSINLNPLFYQSSELASEITPEFSFDKRIIPDEPINLKAEKLKIKKFTITDIDSNFLLKNNQSSFKLNKGSLCDLQTTGYININNEQIVASIPIKANNKSNIQDLLTCLFQKNNFMNGQYSLRCDIQANSSKDTFFKELSGSLKFNGQKGRIFKLTLLSRILSVLNISKIFQGYSPDINQNGFAYNTIVIESDIRESKIYLSKAIINGEDMTLIFSGWIDPFNDEINLTCLVSPFKTVDLIIEKIPIINTLLGGRLVAVPVKATGKLSDPVVTPLHPSAVSKGLLDMMSTILKTPVTLWDKMQSE